MKKATFQEYTEAKKEIMSGGECKEYASTDEYGRNHKTICCENGEAFWEVTENDVTEFWSTKHPDSRKYEAPRSPATAAPCGSRSFSCYRISMFRFHIRIASRIHQI